MPDSLPCSDCGFDFPRELMKATLVGNLCIDCALKVENAAKFLANMQNPKGIFREVQECVRMYREVTSVRSDRRPELAE